jgi:hypothetical protein
MVVADDFEELQGTQRVGSWPMPSTVVLCEIRGEVGVRVVGDPKGIMESTDARGALDALRALEGAPDSATRDFVLAYGLLFETEDEMGVGYGGLPYQPSSEGELVKWYREMASLISATLRITALVRRRRPILTADVATVLRFVDDWIVADYSVKVAASVCRRLLSHAPSNAVPYEDAMRRIPAGVVNGWLRVKEVRPHLTWRGDSDRPVLAWTGGLWGMIGAELMLFIRAEGKTAECDGCGREVTRMRRPKLGQKVWCGAARCRRLRDREAQRRRRPSRSSTIRGQ